MCRALNNQQEERDGPKSSKIRIEEDSDSSSAFIYEKKGEEKGCCQGGNQDKETKKKEELIESIRSMHYKIKGQQPESLRELWKWLKSLGHSQSCLKRWKGKAESGSCFAAERLR